MPSQLIVIDGSNFTDLEEFYNEIDRVMTKDLAWRTGHNLDAFNDMLRGGFGVFEYGEPITLLWTNFAKSRTALGNENIDVLVEIIKEHEHIEFSISGDDEIR